MSDESEAIGQTETPITDDQANDCVEELTRLDVALKEQGSSLADVLRHAASSATGIKV